MGEMMVCRKCGKQQRSNPKKQSQWTAVVIGGLVIYFCPACFGNDQYYAELCDQCGRPIEQKGGKCWHCLGKGN